MAEPLGDVGRAGGVTMDAVPRSARSHRLMWRVLLSFVTAFICLLCLPVEASAVGTPPVISNGQVSPGTLPHEGGSVEVNVDVSDGDGVSSVFAEFLGSDGIYQGTLLSNYVGDTWSGGAYLPPNYNSFPVQYSVYISAGDGAGESSFELIGDVTVDAPPEFDEAPYVSEPSVSPTLLPSTGGSVKFQVSAADNRSISEVFAWASPATGTPTQILMEPMSFNRFEGVFSVPANLGPSAVIYGVTITAVDDAGQSTTIPAESFTVAAPLAPAGPLVLRPKTISFGKIRLGGGRRRSIVVRNAGSKKSVPVEIQAETSGQPFKLLTDEIAWPVVLPPGRSRRFHIEYRPTAVGPQTGTFTARGAGRTYTVALWGSGKR